MTKRERLQSVWHLYESEHGHEPARTRDAVAWAITKGLLREPRPMSGMEIVGECVQLNTDVTVYNDLNAGRNPAIQAVMDFTDDVAERQQGV